ncbi:Metallo-dependent phosphatase-like protein [Flagelloscypha sp. PMI_526]|nr:Metallo-dependent phosphatase-like protein [Flagelloscypha sp. PMI_526]
MTASSIVHLEYSNPSTLPKPPSPSHNSNYTRFVCLSDTHSKIPHGDVPGDENSILLHSGDFTEKCRVEEVRSFVEWLSGLPHRYKIIIAGNHDKALDPIWYEKNHERWHRTEHQPDDAVDIIEDLLTGPGAQSAGIRYLQDSIFTFRSLDDSRDWVVYGSPWTPQFCSMGFNYRTQVPASEIINNFPTHVDILLTHGPPHGIFDRNHSPREVGCKELKNNLYELRPRLHVFGHIHEDHGAAIHDWSKHPTLDLTTYHNEPMRNNEIPSYSSPSELTLQGEESADEDSTAASTVFVNAAMCSKPQFKLRQWYAGLWEEEFVECGGPGYRVVVVDLKN